MSKNTNNPHSLSAASFTVGLPDALNSIRIIVKKAERLLQLWEGAALLAQYPVGIGSSPQGPKQKEGDRKTPEGEYTICMRNDKSRFYRSFGLSYPNIQDAKNGLASGLIDEGNIGPYIAKHKGKKVSALAYRSGRRDMHPRTRLKKRLDKGLHFGGKRCDGCFMEALPHGNSSHHPPVIKGGVCEMELLWFCLGIINNLYLIFILIFRKV